MGNLSSRKSKQIHSLTSPYPYYFNDHTNFDDRNSNQSYYDYSPYSCQNPSQIQNCRCQTSMSKNKFNSIYDQEYIQHYLKELFFDYLQNSSNKSFSTKTCQTDLSPELSGKYQIENWLEKEECKLFDNMKKLKDETDISHQLKTVTECKKFSTVENEKCIRKQTNELGFSINKQGRFTYTCFVPYQSQEKWEIILKKLKNFLTALEESNNCKILFSKSIYYFRGRPVITMNINGFDKTAIIKCKFGLPFFFNKLLITDVNSIDYLERFPRIS